MDEDLRFVKVRLLSVNSERRVMTLQIVDEGSDGADEDAGSDQDVELLSVPGLTARPSLTSTTEAAVLYAGDRPVAIALIDKGRAAVTVEEGGTKLHGVGASNASAAVYVRNAGGVEVTPKSGQDVTLAAGTLRVARETDTVTISAELAAWIADVQTKLTGLGAAPTPLSGTIIGAITAGVGAPNVKA